MIFFWGRRRRLQEREAQARAELVTSQDLASAAREVYWQIRETPDDFEDLIRRAFRRGGSS